MEGDERAKEDTDVDADVGFYKTRLCRLLSFFRSWRSSTELSQLPCESSILEVTDLFGGSLSYPFKVQGI